MDATSADIEAKIERAAFENESTKAHRPEDKQSTNKETKIANVHEATDELKRGYPKEIKTKHRSKVTSRLANQLFLLLRIKVKFNMFSFALCLCLLTCAGAKEQKFAIEPQDQSAVVGSRVTLPCRVESKAGQLQWTKDDFGLGTHRHLTGYERYKMVGSDEEGDYSLDIREVTLDDDAMYQCQVSTGARGETAIRSRYARLIVLVPPEPPRILQGSTIDTVEDQDVSMECVSVGGKPPAEITWVDHDGGVLTQGVTYTVEPMSDGRRFTARSVLSIRPRRQHHNQTFTCQAQNTADRAYRATTIKLEVKYAPKIRMFAKTSRPKGRIQEGDTFSMVCQANANPIDLKYKWYVNNEQSVGFHGNELVIHNVSRKYNDASVKCEVYNSVGKSAESKTLEITYGPSFLIKPQDVQAEDGTEVTLSCLVDGHPQPDVLWLHFMKDRIVKVGKSPNLTLTVTHQSAGQYWCRANVEGYPDVEAHATVYVKGQPRILSNRTQYGIEGDSVRVDCIVFSVPKPDYVMWTFMGHEINSFVNQEYAFLEETLQDGMTKSTLIIRDSHSRHFGTYNCSVTNLYGTDSVEIRLVPDKSFPLIVIISGGASSAIVVLIIMLIIMLCHRRRRKNIPAEMVKKPDITEIGKMNGDHYKDCDRSSNISDLKMELRQVEGGCEMETASAAETEFHTNMHLDSNLGLPLAGPVNLPSAGYDNELMKQLQRYSHDFGDPGHLQFKVHGQANGYVPYVDYNRDYAPPLVHSNDSLNGSMSRSIDTASTAQYNSGQSQNGSLQRMAGLGGYGGPDVIPMTNPSACLSGSVDVRYAATYGNPYLRVNPPVSYAPVNTANPAATPAPPPYYSVKNTMLPPPATSVTSPSSQSSRSVASPNTLGSSSSGAQPQVPKSAPQSPGALYVLSTQQGAGQTQITTKGNGQLTTGTHV